MSPGNIFSLDHGGPVMKHSMNDMSTVQSHQVAGRPINYTSLCNQQNCLPSVFRSELHYTNDYLSDCRLHRLQIHYWRAVRANRKPERKFKNMVWAHCLVAQSMCSAVLTVYKFLCVKLLLPLKGYSRKKNSGGEWG